MTALETLLDELERNDSLDAPDRLRERIDALDRLDARLMHTLSTSDHAHIERATPIHDRAHAVRTRLEAINQSLYESMRREIRRGLTPAWMLERLSARDADDDGTTNGEERYDYLDEVVAGVLQLREPDAEAEALGAEMVFYQPTPARHIFELVRRAELTERDVLIDLGSGLGHVPLLAAICTNARCIGIERDAGYVDSARLCAAALDLSNAVFMHQDARDADFSSGTVFYLYTPFTGTILRTVLDSLRHEAANRAIRICTYGPCTPIVAEEPWIEAFEELRTGRIAVFRSTATGSIRTSIYR